MTRGRIRQLPRRTVFQSLRCKESREASASQGRSGRARSRLPRRSVMETTERKIPTYVLEDLLFQRRLERNLNTELARQNNLLAEQNRLLQERKELMAEVHAAVQQRWEDEEQSVLTDPAQNIGEEAHNA